MFRAAKNQWGNLSELELEEKLAESFRAFMNGQERMDTTQPNKSLLGRIRAIFRKLKNIFNGILGREQYLDTLFYSIYRGRMTNRKEKTITTKEKFMEASEMEAIKQESIANGTFMKAPNGEPTNLDERQWLQVRTKAFKKWFGDWERRAINFLGESTGNIDIADIINTDGSINFKVLEEITDEYFNNADEKLFNKGRKTLRQRREKHYDGNGNLIENNTLEHLQNVTKSALASNIRPDLKPQLILAAALHDLAKPFHGGQIHGFQSLNLVNKLFKGNISPLVKFAIKHHMLTIEENKKFSIDDATRIMQEALDNNLNLDDAIEILLAINTADILSGQSEDSIDYYSKKSKRDTINEEIPFKKSLLVQAKNKLNDVSKVVDENGEPLVVYHGTPNKWNIANIDKAGSITDEGYYGKGLYLSSLENKAKEYNRDGNGMTLSLFVNIKNPFYAGLDEHLNIDESSRRGEIVNLFNRDNEPTELKQYDGVLYTGGDAKYEEIVIRTSNQIKSATDNIGTFDANNDDIRFMRADTFKQELLAHRANKVAYDNLSQEEKEYLALRKVTEKDYEALNTDQKEILLHCM